MEAVAHRDTNLPAPRRRLLGRDEETAAVRELVLHADGRLVTLTGTGGIGKTSLALEAARRLRTSMPDGAWLVTLEAVEEPRRVALYIAQALGLTGSTQLPEDALLDFLEPRQALLVVDDCDEVVEPTAALIDRLLDRCPDLRVLVTCRTRLKVRGETVLVVPPIAVPPREGLDAASLAGVPSVELFVERAREVRPGFRFDEGDAFDVATICRRLDGIPLAIELAAAQAAVLSPAEIAERLPGQDALAAAIDVSLGLLPDHAIRLFRRLAVFAGGWTIAAAEAIGASGETASGDDTAVVTAALTILVERSLVIREEIGGGRFRMLAPVAEHAARLLEESGESDAISLAHATYYLGLVTGGAPGWQPDAMDRLRRIALEYENCLAGIRYAEGVRSAPLVVGYTLAMLDFWGARGLLRAALLRLERALDIVGPEPTRTRGYLLNGLANYGRLAGELDAAEVHARDAEGILEAVGDAVGLRSAIGIRATIATDRGDLDGALALFDRCHALYDEQPSDLGLGIWHVSVADVYRRRGEPSAVRHHLEQARARLEPTPTWYLARVLVELGGVAREDGRLDEATELLASALEIGRSFDAQIFGIPAIYELARVAVAQRSHRRAATLFAAATALRDATGWRAAKPEERDVAADVDRLRAALPDTAFEAAWRRGLALSLDEAAALGVEGEDRADVEGRGVDPLTPREREIAALVAEGLTNPQIAERLAISSGTVRIHVERILGKLGLTSRVQVATWVVRHGDQASVT